MMLGSTPSSENTNVVLIVSVMIRLRLDDSQKQAAAYKEPPFYINGSN
jgi:hypothetical protein